MTLCTVDVVVVWVWPTILLRILQKSHTVRAQAVFGWSQITSLLTSLSCQKLTDIIKNNDISELHHPLEKVWNYCTIYSIARTHSCTLYVHQGWIYKFLDGGGVHSDSDCFILTLKSNTHTKKTFSFQCSHPDPQTLLALPSTHAELMPTERRRCQECSFYNK